MPGIAEFVSGTAGALQEARRRGGIGVLAEFDLVYVQYQVNPELRGTDGRAVMAVEVGSAGRLNRRQKARLRETGWEAPQGRALPNWWHLVASEEEARIVAGQLVILLMDVFGLSANEVLNGFAAESMGLGAPRTPTAPSVPRGGIDVPGRRGMAGGRDSRGSADRADGTAEGEYRWDGGSATCLGRSESRG